MINELLKEESGSLVVIIRKITRKPGAKGMMWKGFKDGHKCIF